MTADVRIALLLSLIAGCGPAVPPTSGTADEVREPVTPGLVVRVEATTGRELQAAAMQFEREQLADVQGLIAAWQPITSLEGTLRIVLVDSGRQDRAVVSEVYGPTHRADARALRERLDAIDTNDDRTLASLMEEVRCRFPGLGNPTVLHYPRIALATPRPELIAWMTEALRRVDDEGVPAHQVGRVFGNTKATTYATAGSRCSMIVFGRAIESGTYPLYPRDAILHEVGHVLELASRSVDRSRPYDARALEEALADVISHAYTGSPCHIPDPTAPGGCRRRLDVPAMDLSVPEAGTPDWYEFGQPARFAGWSLVAGRPIPMAGRTLLDARDSALAVAREFAADLIFGRRPTPAEKAAIVETERATQADFLTALPD